MHFPNKFEPFRTRHAAPPLPAERLGVVLGQVRALDARAALLYFAAVPNATKSSSATQAQGSMPFEEALKKLEAIVGAMESEDLPLESLLTKYEEGTRLAKNCQDKLAEAEVKIQQLEKTASGDLALKPLAAPLQA
jgi:exodeoxyribonuclease VII small subunit